MGWRYIAQRTTTGDFLDWDVPLVASSVPRSELSGPGSLSGTISPEYARLNAKPDGLPVLAEWATTLYAEYEGRIRWGGLVRKMRYEGQALRVDCAGFTSYPHGIPYLGPVIQSGYPVKQKYSFEGKDKNHDGYIDHTRPRRKMPPRPKDKISRQWDAYDVVREVWKHVQWYRYGDLGLVVDGHDSGHKLGSASGKDPWELLWWDNPDCGATIDEVMRLAHADYAESHSWDGSKERMKHRLHLGRRRLGRHRSDLRFAQGENIVEVATPQGMGDAYANDIYVLGKGSGKKTPRVRVASADKRLRRARVITRKSTANLKTLTSYGKSEQKRHNEMLTVPSIAICHHPNAPLGSWALGDRILVQVDVPWVGEIAVWHRITAQEIDPAAGTAILSLTRSDYYG
ncbi:hypothetical protein ACWDZ4_20635 [Streptomyces sp. NPDC003016]